MQRFICDDVVTIQFLDPSDNIIAERKAKNPLPWIDIDGKLQIDYENIEYLEDLKIKGEKYESFNK